MYKLRNFINYPALPTVDQQILWGILDLALKGLVFAGATIGIYSLMFQRDQPYKELKPVISYILNSFTRGIISILFNQTSIFGDTGTMLIIKTLASRYKRILNTTQAQIPGCLLQMK